MDVKKNTNKIWVLTLEPIEQRYSKQWREYFKEQFKENKINFEFIDGEIINSNLKGKFFLDPVQTNVWKFSQLNNLLNRINEINDGDIIFVFDFWYPGVESLKYTFTFLNKKVKIIGYAHAGTYDKWDLTNQYGMESWGKDLENSWFKIYDKVLVATNFHKGMICSKRKVNKDKIKVVGFPLDIKYIFNNYYSEIKEKLIAFTGRKTEEKGYNDILELQRQGFPIIVTLDNTKNKDEYYKLLSRCQYVLSTGLQETFGIGIVEGMALGCIPIVPNRLSYVETVGNLCRKEDIVKNFGNIIKDTKNINTNILFKKAVKYDYKKVIKNIIKELK